MRLINNHETKVVEFKSSFSKCLKNQMPERIIREASLKAVAGFLNSIGGTLLIGVGDDKTIHGIEVDGYSGDDDKYIRQVNDTIKSYLSGYATTLVSVEIVTIKKKKTVCIVRVKPSKRPIYFTSKDDQQFWLRRDRQTIKLTIEDSHQYIKDHFET